MHLAADAVSSADGNPIQRVEDVELRYSQPGEAIDARRIADDDAVEPAASAGTTGSGTVFVAQLANPRSEGLFQLGREWAVADARCVGLHDAERRVDRARSDAHADRRTA